MSGSTFGNIFKVMTWGESHGKALGVVVDGCPAGLALSEEDIQPFLDRRKPGTSKFATQRQEGDRVEILSGVFEGKSTGTPISMVIYNTNQHSNDYREIANYYRPGHADYTYDSKYGFRDYRGGGRSSGRETAARVAAGAIASKILSQFGIGVTAYTKSIGNISIDMAKYKEETRFENPLVMPDADAAEEAAFFLKECIRNNNSSGGIIECVVKKLPVGIGQPVFDKLDALLSSAILSIGAVKGIEFGDGMNAAFSTGLDNNDCYRYDSAGNLEKLTNHSGGVLGGISDGSDLIFRCAVKPTPSIAATQATVSKDKSNIEIKIKGRHDPIIVPRAVVVVEAMTALTLVDLLFANTTSQMEQLIRFYK